MGILRWLGIAFGALVVALLGLGVAARFADGPLAVFPGGRLESGELVTDPDPDFEFARGLRTIELQLLDPPRSRTVWFALHEGRLYVPCGFLDWPLWKQWPYQALEDGRALVRIAGRRFPVTAARVTDPQEYRAVQQVVDPKYGLDPDEPQAQEEVWIFRLDPRPPTDREEDPA